MKTSMISAKKRAAGEPLIPSKGIKFIRKSLQKTMGLKSVFCIYSTTFKTIWRVG